MKGTYKDKTTLHRLFHEEGLTQNEMAKRLGCSHGTISNWMQKYGIETRKEKQYSCDYCSATFSEYPSQVTGENNFCSIDCHAKWQSENRNGKDAPNWQGGKTALNCNNCGDEYKTWESKIRWNGQFCSTDCFYEWSKKSKSTYLYYGENWPDQADKARSRADGVCQRKGCQKEQCDNGAKLHVHHLTPVKEFDKPENAHFQENLVVLCAKHHQRIEAKEDQRKLIKT